MPYEIETKDGIVIRGIPDNIPPDHHSIKAKVANARQAQGVNPQAAGEMALEGMSGLDKFRAGAGKTMTDIARGAGQMLGLVDQKSIDETKQRDAPLMNTGAGMTGGITGGVAVGLPSLLVPGANTVTGAALTGAVLGGVQPTGTDESRMTNALLGAGGGAAGQAGGQLLGRALRPVRSALSPQQTALAASAQARGIPLDAADLTGSRPLKTIRDVLGQLPLTADRQSAIQGAKQTAFNRAVSGTYGAADDAITPQALQAARDRIGQQFTNLSARNTLQAGGGLVNDLATIQQNAARNMTPDVARVIANNIEDILARVEPGDVINGNAYRALDSQLGRILRSSSNGDIRYGIGQLRDALRNAMDQSISASDRAAWQQARRQYANLMTVAPLAARSETGDVSGRTLLAAALRGSKSSAFHGGGELGELGRIGRAFVAEQTPNSGTAQRTFFQNFLTNPLQASWNQAVGGISSPVQQAINSAAGIGYLSQGLAQLTPQQQALINAMTRASGAALPSAYAAQQ